MKKEPKSGEGKRGFAAMSPEQHREIARKGGQSVPSNRRSFSQDRALAAAAGRKGGRSVPDENRSFHRDRDLAMRAGQKGGRVKSKTVAPA